MTVNERLVVADLVQEWDATIQRRDADGAVAILEQVGLTRAGAVETVEAVLADPSFYGYP